MIKKYLSAAILMGLNFTLIPKNNVISIDNSSNIKIFHFKKSRNQNDLKIEKLSDMDGNIKYIMLYNDYSTYVYDLAMENLLYKSDTGYPFNDNTSTHIFIDSPYTNIPFICMENDIIWQSNYENYKINKNSIEIKSSTENDTYEKLEGDVKIFENATLIHNSEYFLKSDGKYGWNDNGVCALVAIQILMNYYDTFYNDKYIPEYYDYVSIDDIDLSLTGSPKSWEKWKYMPGSGNVGINRFYSQIWDTVNNILLYNCKDSRFLNYLIDYCETHFNIFLGAGSGCTFNQQRDTLGGYLDLRGIPYTFTTSEGNLSDVISKRTADIIKKGIDEGKPVIANGDKHSTVAFGYDDEYVYVDSGWGYLARTPWSTYTNGSLFYQPSAIIFNAPNEHVHSNNFFTTEGQYFYCSCGKRMPRSEIIISDLPMDKYSSTTPKTATYSTSSFTANVNYTKAYKTSSNYIRINTGSNISISYAKPINAIYLTLESTYDGKNVSTIKEGDYTIQYKNSAGEWSTPLDMRYLFPYSRYVLGENSHNNIYITYNFEEDTREVRINVNSNDSSSHLIIKKLVLSLC